MRNITEAGQIASRPLKVLQFGEGNFLRAFVDYMIDVANEAGVYNGNIAIVKPIIFGDLAPFKKQQNLYTVSLRGKREGSVYEEYRLIKSVETTLDCYAQYDEYEALASLPSLEIVISNTTEAGIVYDDTELLEMTPPNTYPGKLTKFLYKRYQVFQGDISKGLILMPVELIENNGSKLRECVLKLAKLWKLEDEFIAWIHNACTFCSTLVDRIVTGYPRTQAASICEKMGYQDALLDVAEPFGLWVIESDKDISERFPLDKAGLPVVFTRDQRPYRERKVRILNGAHTSTVLAGYLLGKNMVRECMEDALIRSFMENIVKEEIVPTVKLPKEEALDFAAAVFERFENPFVDHQLLSISLNSVSKWRARILATFEDCVAMNNTLPKLITFSFAALLAFYTGSKMENGALIGKREGNTYEIHDNADVLSFFQTNSVLATEEYVHNVMAHQAFWGRDLTDITGFEALVNQYLTDIRTNGMENAMKHALEK